MSSAAVSSLCLCCGSWEKQGYSHCCCETTFFCLLLIAYGQPQLESNSLSKAPQMRQKGRFENTKKSGKRSASPVFLPRIQENVHQGPFRINFFWQFKDKMKYGLWEFITAASQSWEYHSFGIHFAWQTAVFQYGKSGANRCIAWGVYWVFKRKRTAGCAEDEFGQVTLKLAWRRLQTACRRELLRCSRDTSAESLSLKWCPCSCSHTNVFFILTGSRVASMIIHLASIPYIVFWPTSLETTQ